MNLGQKIRFYREKQNIGQEHLAALSHISVSTIRKYESGDRNPKEDQIERLAHALHIAPSMLRDNHIDDISEIVPVFYKIGNKTGIQFDGIKDENGDYIPDKLSIKFNDSRIMNFLTQWANKKDEIDRVSKDTEQVKFIR